MNIKYIVMLCGVVALGIADVRKKTIPLAGIGALLGFCVSWNIITGDQMWWQMLFGMVPAAVLIPVKKIAKVNVGTGDILLLMVLGVAFGAEGAMSVMLTASLICVAGIAVMWLIKRLKKGVMIPFVPFIGAGLCVSAVLG